MRSVGGDMEEQGNPMKGILVGVGLAIFCWLGLWVCWLAVTRWW